ncbi:TRL-like family protein [Leptospira sp. 201903070]|uniref:TRL-like family protein n=1 Tax=Leptospira ainlahdjerensis TaxID=2810033 RepID=A0ABS2U6G9_9LEPT|nr:TRL-like family protein [Leptospira ainlahdjerensis]MBM9575962.1 TRL-like family protein [Leptospira ainlahdjerensis]
MKNQKSILLLILSLFFFVNCASGPVGGLLFTYNKYPGQINPANDVKPEKIADGCIHNIFGLISFGNAGAGAVAKSNGIQRIALIDYSALHILAIVYRNHCVIVAGEKE